MEKLRENSTLNHRLLERESALSGATWFGDAGRSKNALPSCRVGNAEVIVREGILLLPFLHYTLMEPHFWIFFSHTHLKRPVTGVSQTYVIFPA